MANVSAPGSRPAVLERMQGVSCTTSYATCLHHGQRHRRSREIRNRLRGLAPAERQQIVAYSSSEEANSTVGSSGAVSEHPEEGTRIRRTMGNLDALLGIEEELPKDKQASDAKV